MTKLSIIIPLGPHEDQLMPLLYDLAALKTEAEIILVSCGGEALLSNDKSFKWIESAQGRAVQQNAGAKVAEGEFLWFLHADSRVLPQVVTKLEQSLKVAPYALHYFHLKFKKDGPWGMGFNEAGAWFRSQILRLPFGDQGFCLRKDIFMNMGGFSEDVAYGEDHLLVWTMRQAGFKLRCTGAALPTSARKYTAYGWGALTLKYQYLWIRQAAPEFFKLIAMRWRGVK